MATCRLRPIPDPRLRRQSLYYIGPGSVDGWRGNLLNSADLSSMSGKISMFVMMTCLNGYFADLCFDSLGGLECCSRAFRD
jgi:hypothetical protein